MPAESDPLTSKGVSPASVPPASVIICTRNRAAMLSDLVASILASNEQPAEIVIIDDSSEPPESMETPNAIGGPQIRHIWSRSVGLSRANNTGIALARHDLLVFTQDDVLVTPTWFGEIVRALLAAGHRAVVTGQVRPGEPEGPDAGFAPSTKSMDTPMVYQGRIGKDVLYVQNMAIWRSALDEIGGFDPRLGPGTPFPSAEDNDFAFRLLEAGYRILYEPAAVTYHRAWRSRRDMLQVAWGYGLGQGAYYAKHLSLSDPYMLKRLLMTAAKHLLRLPLYLWRQRDQASDSAAFAVGLLAGAGQWLVGRK